MDIKKEVLRILEYSRLSSVLLILAANFFNSVVTFVINIVVAKRFGPEDYGVFSLIVSVMMTIYLIVNLGLNITTIRFFNLYVSQKKDENVLLKHLFILRFFLLLLTGIVALPLSKFLCRVLEIGDTYYLVIVISIISGGVFGLWIYIQNYLQVYKKFRSLTTYIAGYGIFRILIFGSVFYVFVRHFDLIRAFVSLYTLPLLLIVSIGLIPILKIIIRKNISAFRNFRVVIQDVLNYSKWVALSSICYNLIYRFITFILASRSSKYELGLMSAGFVFTIAFSTLNMAVRTVFFPYVSAFNHINDIRKHLRRVTRILPYFIFIVILGGAILVWVQVTFLGDEYARALPVFLITASALASTVFLGLISMLLHTFMLPEVDAYTNVGRFILAGILVYILAPEYGALGGAISYASSLILGEVFMVYYVYRKVYNEK